MRHPHPDDPVYAISIAAELVDSHPQTLRMYERVGLVCPQRNDHNVRLYSQRDIERIQAIQTYTSMGVNLAGIEIIFRLLHKIEHLEERLEQREGELRERIEHELAARLRAELRRNQ